MFSRAQRRKRLLKDPLPRRGERMLRDLGPPYVSFFGHPIGKLLAPDRVIDEEFVSIDRELESSLEIVRQKLKKVRPRRFEGAAAVGEKKHQRFIDDRNMAQEALFQDIVRCQQDFGTGLYAANLRSLHDLMGMEADHEALCSREESVHELIECDLLRFLRKKAEEGAWEQLEGYLTRFHIPFPVSPSMEDPAEPARNERVMEERKKSAQSDFLQMPSHQLAELIVGNVPNWVYSYPQKDTYLWKLTVLQGVTAAIAADSLMNYLAVWEEEGGEILKEVEAGVLDQIDTIRKQSESASEVPEILSISKDIQRISREQIPDQIWRKICAKRKAM
jgi:hypothetical protein